jgi:hypothetical protein
MRGDTPVQRDVLPLGREHSKLVRPPHVTAPPMRLWKRDLAMTAPYKGPPTTNAPLKHDTSTFLPYETRYVMWSQRWT